MRAVILAVVVCLLAGTAGSADVQWRFKAEDSRDFAKPEYDDSGWQTVDVGYKWKSAGYAWFRATIEIPKEIDGKSTEGQAVGLEWNSCDGGECYLDGKVFCRYDNDHPALVVLTDGSGNGLAGPTSNGSGNGLAGPTSNGSSNGIAGRTRGSSNGTAGRTRGSGNGLAGRTRRTRSVAVRAFMGPDTSEHDGKLDCAQLTIIDPKIIKQPFEIRVDAAKSIGPMPHTFAGLSQGAGLPDYDDSTAAIFKEWGFKWFRMDNVLTNAVKKNDDGTTRYDWSDLDKRLDFMKKVGCEFIFCISYMPEALDAVPNGERHSYPRDWDEFGELVYQAAKHCIDRGTPVKYWEVWNEINTGWMVDPPGWDHLKTYLTLYDTCWKAVRRADPKAWIGGPCVASGPWNDKDPRGPGANGEKFMRGLFEHCEKTGAPLDFVTWHEYFQNYGTMKKEADQIKEYLKEYPKVQKQVKEYAITEWSYAWWHDRAQDNEVGAAWAAASVLRGWMPAGVQKPCWFVAKEWTSQLSGEWGMFTHEGKPKAVANVSWMFNKMPDTRVQCVGEDDQIASVAAIDPKTGRLDVLVLNFGERFGSPRKVRLALLGVPKSTSASGLPRVVKRYLVDATHSNIANDAAKYALETVPVEAKVSNGALSLEFELANNAVTVVEIAGRSSD